MASTYEKSVKGATKVKLAAPKSKYIEHLLMATQSGSVDQVFRPLSFRLKDSTWTIVFKALIVAHILIRDGYKDVTLQYLSEQPRYFSTSHVSTAIVSEQGENIRDYSRYLQIRVQAWKELNVDYAAQNPGGEQVGRLKKLAVDKGLLREVEGVLRLVGALLKCKFFLGDLSNDITLTAFRLLVSDLLVLFQPLNEGVMNVLGHYFEMPRTDAERSLRIYRTFVERTNDVIEYLSEAKALEDALGFHIPNVKHAPTGLTQALEEYLNDPDFETNRKQYLESKEKGKSTSAGKTSSAPVSNKATTTKATAPSKPDPTNPFNSLTNRPKNAPTTTDSVPKQQNLIDFFASIGTEQTSVISSAQQQRQQFVPQSQVYTNPAFVPTYTQPTNQYPPTTPITPITTTPTNMTFYTSPQSYPPQPNFAPTQQPIRPEWTGAGFGGYTPSSAASAVHIPSTSTTPTQFSPTVQTTGLQAGRNATETNPFRASAITPTNTQPTFSSDHGTNPFSAVQRSQTLPTTLSNTPSYSNQTAFGSVPPQSSTFQQSNQSQPIVGPLTQTATPQVSTPTGTNPFSRTPQLNTQARLTPQATGSNPFRQNTLPLGGTSTVSNGFGWSSQ